MEIIISLPQCQEASTYRQLQGYLKQLELAIHHAQKSVEAAEKNGIEITEDCYAIFEHQSLKTSLQMEEKKGLPTTAEEFIDNYYGELQEIELKINLI